MSHSDKALETLFPAYKELPESGRTFALGAAFGAMMFQWGLTTGFAMARNPALLPEQASLNFEFAKKAEAAADQAKMLVQPIRPVSHSDELDAALENETVKQLRYLFESLKAAGASEDELKTVSDQISLHEENK